MSKWWASEGEIWRALQRFFTFHRHLGTCDKSCAIFFIINHFPPNSSSSLSGSSALVARWKLINVDIILRSSAWIIMQELLTLDYLLVCNTYFGRFMKRNLGRKSMKKILIHGFMVCVWGDRKWTFSTTTVTHILRREEEK